MAAIVRAFARTFPSVSTGHDELTTILTFCGVGLLLSLGLVAVYGIDLSVELF
jgi:hypothetical protein